MFFLNERPVEYPGCSVGLCSWEYIKNELWSTSEQCDFEFCYQSTAAKHTLTSVLLLTLPVMLLKLLW